MSESESEILEYLIPEWKLLALQSCSVLCVFTECTVFLVNGGTEHSCGVSIQLPPNAIVWLIICYSDNHLARLWIIKEIQWKGSVWRVDRHHFITQHLFYDFWCGSKNLLHSPEKCVHKQGGKCKPIHMLVFQNSNTVFHCNVCTASGAKICSLTIAVKSCIMLLGESGFGDCCVASLTICSHVFRFWLMVSEGSSSMTCTFIQLYVCMYVCMYVRMYVCKPPQSVMLFWGVTAAPKSCTDEKGSIHVVYRPNQHLLNCETSLVRYVVDGNIFIAAFGLVFTSNFKWTSEHMSMDNSKSPKSSSKWGDYTTSSLGNNPIIQKVICITV